MAFALTSISLTLGPPPPLPSPPAPLELATYSLLQDACSDASKDTGRPPSRLQQAVAAVPVHLRDIGVGAIAGAAAVCISMPFDCIKTYIQVSAWEALQV